MQVNTHQSSSAQSKKRFVPLATFKVATSYEEALRIEEEQARQHYQIIQKKRREHEARLTRSDHEEVNVRNSARSVAFAKLENKEELAVNLRCTKACRNVVPTPEQIATMDWPYGVCTREFCLFAHSFQEFRYPQCVFGAECNRWFFGSNCCRFQHPGEDASDFRTRTGFVLPDLPPTSALTRVPKVAEPVEAGKEDPTTSPLKRCDAVIVPNST